MYKPSRNVVITTSKKPGYFPSSREVKPLSFYVAGGPDVDGDALKQDSRSLTDPDADDDAWMSLYGTDADGNPAVFADPFCDPRQDVFSIADMATNPSFAKAVRKAYEDASGSSSSPDTSGSSSDGSSAPLSSN